MRAARSAASILLALVAPALPATAADIAAGKAVFQRCRICHTVAAGAGTRVGPDLHGIFGRKAGTWDDFSYSTALKRSGIVWSDKSLTDFLKNPSKFIPGNRMAFPGIGRGEDIANLLAYLHRAAQ